MSLNSNPRPSRSRSTQEMWPRWMWVAVPALVVVVGLGCERFTPKELFDARGADDDADDAGHRECTCVGGDSRGDGGSGQPDADAPQPASLGHLHAHAHDGDHAGDPGTHR